MLRNECEIMSYEVEKLSNKDLIETLLEFQNDAYFLYKQSVLPPVSHQLEEVNDIEYAVYVETVKEKYRNLCLNIQSFAKAAYEECFRRLKTVVAVNLQLSVYGRIIVSAVCPACKKLVTVNSAFTSLNDTLQFKCPVCGVTKNG